MSQISNYSVSRKFDPDSRYMQSNLMLAPNPEENPNIHELDQEAGRTLFIRLWTWWNEARDGHFRSRSERLRDHEMYDGRQWTDEEIAALQERGQAPLVFNVIKQTVDWIVGTERRTRVDWNVLPRNEEDVEGAGIKKALMKYVSDTNKLGWHRSAAFKDCVISGLGITEGCKVNDRNQEPITERYVDWKSFWWDPHSRDNLFEDCRYVIRAKYLDLDYAISMFPDREALIRASAQSNLDPGLELVDDDAQLSSLYVGSRSILSGSVSLILGTSRQRVRIFEMWYREPKNYKRLESVVQDDSDPLHNVEFVDDSKEHQEAIDSGLLTLTEGVTDEMKLAFFVDTGLLKTQKSPYKHGRYPFTPYWAYRDHLTGMPYGVVRNAIDPQLDYNKRRSKALHLLLVNKVIYEDGAIDEDDEQDVLDEAQRPDGRVRLRKGALSENRFQIKEHGDMMGGHVRLMEEDKENIHEATGVTRDNVGQNSNAISGRAIIAKQQQGAVTTAELFDNYRLGMQESGEKTLCNVEQFMSLPKVFRVLGPEGKATWEKINQPVFDADTNTVSFDNDITAHSADYIVDQQDYRETMRMALGETLFELIGKLPPDVAMALLDLAVDMLDLPNKAAIANRIRQITGQPAPGTENTPEAEASRDAERQKREEQRLLQDEDLKAKVRLNLAKADKTESEATTTRLKGKREALDTAGLVNAAMPIAPAADRLYEGSKTQ